MKKIFFTVAFLFATMLSQPAHADEIIPAIISISPVSGTTDGGTSVTISGASFTGSTVIKVDGVAASVSFVDSNTITLSMPAHSAGFVDFSASNGMVAAISSNIYEYVSLPPAAPAPAPAPAPAVVIEQPQESLVVEEVSLEAEASPDVSTELVDLSRNSYLLYEDRIENLVIENTYNVPNQFLLKERVDGKWTTVSKSYQFNNNVVYLNTNMNVGSTYKVVVKIDGVTTIVSWFKVLMVLEV